MFEGTCPYRGLEVFDVEHAPFFFGRAALIEWLVEGLRPREGKSPNRFLGIIGTSGRGKSSLARAGLLADIKRGALPGSADRPLVALKPGSNPLESLAVRLAKDPAGIAAIEGQLRTDLTCYTKPAALCSRTLRRTAG